MHDLVSVGSSTLTSMSWDLAVVSAVALLVMCVPQLQRALPAHRHRFSATYRVHIPAEAADDFDAELLRRRRHSANWTAALLLGSVLAARMVLTSLDEEELFVAVVAVVVVIGICSTATGLGLPLGDVVSPLFRGLGVVVAGGVGVALVDGSSLTAWTRSLLLASLLIALCCHIALARTRATTGRDNRYLDDALAAQRCVSLAIGAAIAPHLAAMLALVASTGLDPSAGAALLVAALPIYLLAFPELRRRTPRFRTRRWPELPPDTIAGADWTHASVRGGTVTAGPPTIPAPPGRSRS